MRAIRVIGLQALVASLVACGDPGPTGGGDAVRVSAGAYESYRSVCEMVAASDVVLLGSVLATAPGRVVGLDPPPSPYQDDPIDPGEAITMRQVTLQVQQTFAGSVATPTVLLEEEGWTADGAEFENEDLPKSEEGTTGLYFLHRKTDAPTFFRVVNHQGYYRVAGGTLSSSLESDPVADEVEGVSVPSIESDLIAPCLDAGG